LKRFPDDEHRTEVLSRIEVLSKPSSTEAVTPRRRVAADAIDYAAYIGIIIGMFAILDRFELRDTWFAIVWVLPPTLHWLLVWRAGRSLGQWLAGLRVTNRAGKAPNVVHSLAYSLFWIALPVAWMFLGIAVAFSMWDSGLSAGLLVAVLFTVTFVGTLASTWLTARLTQGKRAIYDILARTAIVRQRLRQGRSESTTLQVSGWSRLGADTIDALVVILLGYSVALAIGLLEMSGSAGRSIQERIHELLVTIKHPHAMPVFFLPGVGYYFACLRNLGQTLGMRVLGFRLLASNRGAPRWTNTYRYALCIVNVCIFVLGGWWYPQMKPLALISIGLALLNPLSVRKWNRSGFDFVAGTQALRAGGR
jgi:uncharacterized RDD family membrane protein YckC